MSGPIIRSRSSRKYVQNFAAAFGGGAKKTAGQTAGAKPQAAQQPAKPKKKS